MNTLYYGENLDVLRRYMAEQPGLYNVLFAERGGSRAASQIKARRIRGVGTRWTGCSGFR